MSIVYPLAKGFYGKEQDLELDMGKCLLLKLALMDGRGRILEHVSSFANSSLTRGILELYNINVSYSSKYLGKGLRDLLQEALPELIEPP